MGIVCVFLIIDQQLHHIELRGSDTSSEEVDWKGDARLVVVTRHVAEIEGGVPYRLVVVDVNPDVVLHPLASATLARTPPGPGARWYLTP